jgi:hypothetical protein
VTSDNCGVNTVANDAPASFPVGLTTVTWRVTDIHGNTNTCVQTVTVTDNLPAITTQPVSVTNLIGTTAEFNVAASSCTALSHQWWFNATNLLTGETGATLTLTNVQPTNAGSYHVVVQNAAGAVTSAVAMLTVLVPPTITTQPTNLTVFAGTAGTFTVVAAGTPAPDYQWFFAQSNYLSWATGATLTITNAQPPQSGAYHVVVTNAAGAVTSLTAQLLVVTTNQIKLDTIVMAGGGGQPATLTFEGLAGLSYTVLYRDDVATGSWQSLTNIGTLPATQPITVQDFGAASQPHRYYRLVTPMQP